ncbi:hypothetical protein ACJX0J_016707 [Zea mays]
MFVQNTKSTMFLQVHFNFQVSACVQQLKMIKIKNYMRTLGFGLLAVTRLKLICAPSQVISGFCQKNIGLLALYNMSKLNICDDYDMITGIIEIKVTASRVLKGSWFYIASECGCFLMGFVTTI